MALRWRQGRIAWRHRISQHGFQRQRLFQTGRPVMVEANDIQPSSGEDPTTLVADATTLVDQGRWNLCNDGKGLEREFKFKTFNATWAFMNAVAEECKKERHHPEWSNVYNKTKIRWTTHNPLGLSSKDIRMAKFCDERATEKGEIVPEEQGGGGKQS